MSLVGCHHRTFSIDVCRQRRTKPQVIAQIHDLVLIRRRTKQLQGCLRHDRQDHSIVDVAKIIEDAGFCVLYFVIYVDFLTQWALDGTWHCQIVSKFFPVHMVALHWSMSMHLVWWRLVLFRQFGQSFNCEPVFILAAWGYLESSGSDLPLCHSLSGLGFD